MAPLCGSLKYVQGDREGRFVLSWTLQNRELNMSLPGYRTCLTRFKFIYLFIFLHKRLFSSFRSLLILTFVYFNVVYIVFFVFHSNLPYIAYLSQNTSAAKTHPKRA